MAESKFIRSMTLAVSVAKSTGEDISQTLLDRAAAENNPVHQGILQLMADKRFLKTVRPVMLWIDDATKALEAFADSLESMRSILTPDLIETQIEDFLLFWLMQMKHRQQIYEASRKARKKAKMLDIGNPGLGEGDQGDSRQGDGEGKTKRKDISEALSELVDPEKESDGDTEEGMGIGSGDPKMEQVRRENIFLNSIPESLKKLALQIGRAGKNDIATSGRFLTASKSDIEGITVGNNLSALLPSEVALLSEKSTQIIFYRNYAEKRLQMFASASQSSHPDTHKDGPVIICVDESASMIGEPLETAITLAYAVTIVAKRRHRQVLIAAYSDLHRMMRVNSLGRQRKQLLNFLTNSSMGGNDENAMFDWLFHEILPEEEDFNTADILCVSDFGWVSIEEDIKMLIEEEKAKGMRFYGLNILGRFGSWSDLNLESYEEGSSPMSVCDSVWEYHDGQCREVKKPSR